MTLELYNSPFSTCSQKTRMCLHEKSLEWVNHDVNLLNFEQLRPEYLAINPHGVVPTLVHDGVPIVDSSVIIEYLDDAFTEPPLSPVNLKARAGMRAWMRYFEEVPTQAIRVPTFNALLVASLRDMSEAKFESLTAAMPLRRQFYRRMNLEDGGFDERDTADSHQRLRSALEKVNEATVDNRWICGDQFTLADMTLMPTVVRLQDLGMADLWDDLPGVSGWYARLQQRPSFGKTYYEGTRVGSTPP
jgi:glutathione S-transferase